MLTFEETLAAIVTAKPKRKKLDCYQQRDEIQQKTKD